MDKPGHQRDLQEAIARESRERHPTLRPRDAATLLLLRRDGGSVEVLAGRRSDQHKFMPGVYVFPGGRRDAGDSRVAVTGELAPAVLQRLGHRAGTAMNAARMRALAVTAIRETWEEAGLMIGALRTANDAGRMPFVPDISRLRFVARAITPPGGVRRFDTRFFALFTDEIDLDMSLLSSGSELERLEWVRIGGASELKMPEITRKILTDINEMLAVSPQLSFEMPVPFYYMRRGKFVREEI